MLWKSLFLMATQEFSTVEIWPSDGLNWQPISAIFVFYSSLRLIWYAICLCFEILENWPIFQKIQIQILKKAHLGFLGSSDMLFLMCQANYCEKISLMGIFSLVNCNTPGLHHLQQPTRHTRQCGTHTFTPLSSCTNVYKYSYFPRTVVDWNALPDSARSAPSTDSFRAALHRLSTSPSNSHC